MFLSTHAVLLWRRRSEFRTLNVTLPPIKWETFRKDYLIAGKFRAGPEKFARTPDVRFGFDDDCDAFEKALENALSGAEKSCDVHLEINRFPSYRELAFICISTLFTLAAVGLMKI
ncbi:unnamed protein product [Anisakis simplex]|uniref:Uncharacterized protein n=1 Tax=Anisakis simplex TaxID=6269 RepID=A0A0M3KGE0_ANISI|nr:unnamed protein product [Anisakis simplex]